MTPNGRARGAASVTPGVPALDAREDALLAEVRRTNHLLAVLAVRGMEQRPAIGFLDSAGFRHAEIAAALGITKNAVKKTLHRLRTASAAADAGAGAGPPANDEEEEAHGRG